MREAPYSHILQLSALIFLCCVHNFKCSKYSSIANFNSSGLDHDTVLSPNISPSLSRPFLPLVAPSPLMPFTNNGVPKLSGLCTLNFSAHESLLNTTATDCWGPFAPYLSNNICCPQFKATLTILIGDSSKYSGEFDLNSTVAKHCLEDIDQILQSQGAIENLHEMCKISVFNLTHGSCPLINTNELDQILDYTKLLAKCGKIDIVSECCARVCQKEISNAASIIANMRPSGAHLKSKSFFMKEDCKSVVLRWISTKLDQVSMKALLRGISSCEINKVSCFAKHCLEDIDQILQSEGVIENLHEMCKISVSNLTHGSCPLINTNELDQILDYTKLLAKCGKIDIVSECCTGVCQKEISNAASIIANTRPSGAHLKSKSFFMKEDCESVVLRWISTKLDQVSMKALLRGISSCEINKECPLVLPHTKNISKNCRNTSNVENCCNAMENYLSQLQEQTLLTNLQALNCAQLLGTTLQKANVTRDVYNICRIKLKDFTLQAGAPVSSQGPGCLLPSLPSDATYDNTFGISFVCDLNDNVAATWPSNSSSSVSSCDNSTMLPALPKATSAGTGRAAAKIKFHLVILILLSLV